MENYIVKYFNNDSQNKSFNANLWSEVESVVTDSDGNSYVAYYYLVENNRSIVAVMKVNPIGEVQWISDSLFFNTVERFGKQNEVFNPKPKIVIDPMRNIYVAYQTDSYICNFTRTGVTDIVVFSLNSKGLNRWVKQGNQLLIAGSDTVILEKNNYNTVGSNLDPDISMGLDGNLYLCFSTNNIITDSTRPNKKSDIVVFSLLTKGTFKWLVQSELFNRGDINNLFPRITTDAQSTCYIACNTSFLLTNGSVFKTIGIFSLNSTAMFMEYGQLSNPLDSSSKQLHLSDIQAINTGVVYILYQDMLSKKLSTINPDNTEIVFVSKLFLPGVIQWTTALTYSDKGSHLILDPWSNCYVSSVQSMENIYKIYLSKLSPDGAIEWTRNPFASFGIEPYPIITIDSDHRIGLCYNSRRILCPSANSVKEIINLLNLFSRCDDSHDKITETHQPFGKMTEIHQPFGNILHLLKRITKEVNRMHLNEFLLYNLLNDFVIVINAYLLDNPTSLAYEMLISMTDRINNGLFYDMKPDSGITMSIITNSLTIKQINNKIEVKVKTDFIGNFIYSLIDDITGKIRRTKTAARTITLDPPNNSLYHVEYVGDSNDQRDHIVSSDQFVKGIAIRAVGDRHLKFYYQNNKTFRFVPGETISVAIYGGIAPYTVTFYFNGVPQETDVVATSDSVSKSMFKIIGQGRYMIKVTDLNGLNSVLVFRLLPHGYNFA
jgi:hypothetical protein